MDDDEFVMPRVHGLHRPFDVLQYVALFAYTLFTTALVAIHGPLIDPGVFKVVAVTGLLIWLALSIASYVVAAMAPAHDDGANTFVSGLELDYPPEGKKACQYCYSIVSPETKHCWDCNKCVYRFDHHCRWLNTCIGEKNYTHFAVFLSNTLTLMAIQTGVALFFFVEYFSDRDSFERRSSRVFGRTDEHSVRALVAVLFIVFLLEFLSLAMLVHLQGLHVYLFFRKLTTYKWILEKRETLRNQRAARRALGMEPGTPVCHELAVWQFKRAHPTSGTEAKYQENDGPPGEASGDGSRHHEVSEGSLPRRGVDEFSDEEGIPAPSDLQVAPSPKLDFTTEEEENRSSTPNCGGAGTEGGGKHVQ